VPRKLTPQSAETRTRILEATAALLCEHGPARTTIEAICVASGTSRSQRDQHFGDKDAINVAAVRAGAEALIASQKRVLATVHHRRPAGVAGQGRGGQRGGRRSLRLHAGLVHDAARRAQPCRARRLGRVAKWGELPASGLLRIREARGLAPDADVDALATGVVAALQGGYILAQAARDYEPLAIALDMALERVRSLSWE
jgi:TetR/AcrR family transcriptional regulator, transcriptional repressor for nem operon